MRREVRVLGNSYSRKLNILKKQNTGRGQVQVRVRVLYGNKLFGKKKDKFSLQEKIFTRVVRIAGNGNDGILFLQKPTMTTAIQMSPLSLPAIRITLVNIFSCKLNLSFFFLKELISVQNSSSDAGTVSYIVLTIKKPYLCNLKVNPFYRIL